jgi:hypothetical protein
VVTDNVDPVIYPIPGDITLNIDPGECTRIATLTNPVATDNCQGSLVITSNAPTTFLLGSTNVRWQIADANGNVTIYNQQVTVVDNEGPKITGCPTSSYTAAAAGSNCSAVVTWPALSAVDACSGMKSFTTNYAPGTLFPVGTTHVLYIATDNKDNVATCAFDVVVTDADPTIACIGNQTRNTNAGTCSYKVLGNEFDPVAFADNCTVQSLGWSFTEAGTSTLRTGSNTLSGVVIPRGAGVGATGQTVITWTVTDNNAHQATCSFLLTIEDHEPPIIVVPGNQIRYVDNNKNYYTTIGTEFDNVTATDNCGIVVKLANVYNLTTLSGYKFNIGINPIEWYALDDKGNRSDETFYVTVYDDEPPVVVTAASNTNANATTSCAAVVNYTLPVFMDYGTDPTLPTYTVSPVWAVRGASFPVGVTEVTYTVTDLYGNVLAYTFNVTVTDTQNPSITCPAGSPFSRLADNGKAYHTHSGTAFDPTAFSDNCDVTIANNYNNGTTLTGSTFAIGTTPVLWTATDANLNTATCSIEVVVTDDQPPVIIHCPDSPVARNSDAGQCYYTIPGSEYDPYGFTDNHLLSKLTYQIGADTPVGIDLTTSLSGVKIPVGTIGAPTTTVTWRLTDVSSNVATCVTVFTITDIEPPVVTTVSNQTRSTNTGQPDYTAVTEDGWNPTVTDNCAVASVEYQVDGGTPVPNTIVGQHFSVGTHSVLWTATDIHGNTGIGSYQVTITDDQDPVIKCNDIIVQLSALGIYTLTEDNIEAIGAGSSDPNGIAGMTVTPDAFTCSNVGANGVTLTVTDNNGNESTCSAVVTVQDVTPPEADCQDLTVELDGAGQAVILPAQLNDNSTDACGIKSLSASRTTFGCNDFGNITVILTVTDNNNNTATCSAVVTVQDNILPSAVCTPITVYLNSSGSYSLTESDINAISAGSADNCPLVKTVTPNTFDCNPVGANAVTLTVTDPRGNFNECSTTVTVIDNIPPTANCQNIDVYLDASGHATITASQIDDGSTDNCDVSSLAASKTAFTCADKGVNVVILTVTDVNGNAATCSSEVTILDDINPGITCTGNKAVNTDNNVCTYTHAGTAWDATANDGCTTINSLSYALSGATTVITLPNTTLAGQIFNKGETAVLWTATDGSGNTATCSFTVNVSDIQPPNAICRNVTVQLDGSGNASVTAAQVDNGSNDPCGLQPLAISPSTFTCANWGANTVVLTVTDLSGNSATCSSTVTVQDLIPPVAHCNNIPVQLNAAGAATIVGADVDDGSTDKCAISTRTVSPNSFTCANVGTPVAVVLTVSDAAGNTATCSTTVTVQDKVAPIAICKNIPVSLDGTGNATITAADIDNGSNDACLSVTLAASKTSFTCADKGANTVVLTVTDVNGNTSSCNATVTIQDVTKPTITFCPENKTVNTATGICTYTHNGDTWNATATDNCAGTSLGYLLTGLTTGTGTTLDGVTFNKGLTNVLWTATDATGNSQTCGFTVTVKDIELPVAQCTPLTIQLDRIGNYTLSGGNITSISTGSTDNCGIVTRVVAPNTFTCANISTPVNVTLTVTDAAGNSATCATTITVEDKQAPTLDDLADKNKVTDAGVCTYTHQDDTWNVTDNCSLTSRTYTVSGATTEVTPSPHTNTTLNGQIFNKGTTLVTWTASDASGNSGTTAFNVIVTDNQKPTITCPDNITQTVATSGATSASVTGIPNPTTGDNCAVTKLTYALSGATTAAAQSSGINNLNSGTFNVGTTTVTYVVSDAATNAETCAFIVTINAQDGAIMVSKTSVTTSENLTYEEFTVTLGSPPTGTVVIDVSSDNTSEGTVSVTQLTFNAGNWNTPQTVRVTGVNDFVQDGNISYHVDLAINKSATNDLSGYENASPVVVNAINNDNDVAGVTVSPLTITTTEAGGTATFTMVLNSQPVQTVTFTVTSNDWTEGKITGPADSTITFTAGEFSNWNVPQTITVTGKDELID